MSPNRPRQPPGDGPGHGRACSVGLGVSWRPPLPFVSETTRRPQLLRRPRAASRRPTAHRDRGRRLAPGRTPEARRPLAAGRRGLRARYQAGCRRRPNRGRLSEPPANPRLEVQAGLESGKTTIMVEFRDRLYPGSFYTLTYDPRADRLTGVYHHLGVHQDFDVVFAPKRQNPQPSERREGQQWIPAKRATGPDNKNSGRVLR